MAVAMAVQRVQRAAEATEVPMAQAAAGEMIIPTAQVAETAVMAALAVQKAVAIMAMAQVAEIPAMAVRAAMRARIAPVAHRALDTGADMAAILPELVMSQAKGMAAAAQGMKLQQAVFSRRVSL